MGKKNNIPVGPGRGSGAGSLAAYSLGITDIDPIKHDLIFERFLNPERLSIPDFDIDFCMDKRDDVIKYVSNKYGIHNVSQIITFNTLSAKAVIRDVGRILGHPYGFVDKIAKMIPNELGIKLKNIINDDNSILKKFCNKDESAYQILKISIKLEGLVKGVGKHAAGVVIAPSKITNFLPIYVDEELNILTQFDKHDIEYIGLVKFDFLGLRTLTIIKNTVDTIVKKYDNNFNIKKIKNNDNKVFDILKTGQTTGVFQLESYGIKELIKRLKPDNFKDIVAIVALYRPGPLNSGMIESFIKRKHGLEEIFYLDSSLESILHETYGIIVYQEQVMKIAENLANYSPSESDILCRSMSKKETKSMEEQFDIFYDRSVKNNISPDVSKKIFKFISEFAKYGFNKSHSTAYAYISYQTAYLKTYFKEAFMSSVLSADMDNTEKVSNVIMECREIGIEISPPNINKSKYYFSISSNKILFGLGGIKGVGKSASENIINERKINGNYKDLYDFCNRVDLRKVNKRTCEALIFSGSMKDFNKNHFDLKYSLIDIMKHSEKHKKKIEIGQIGLFNYNNLKKEHSNHIKINYNIKQNKFENNEIFIGKDKLIKEKEYNGIFLSGHIIKYDSLWINHFNLPSIKKIKNNININGKTIVPGFVNHFRKFKTKKGYDVLILRVDDGKSFIDFVNFNDSIKINPKEYKKNIHFFYINIKNYYFQRKIFLEDICSIEKFVEKNVNDIHIRSSKKYIKIVLKKLNEFSIKNSINKDIKIFLHIEDGRKRSFSTITKNVNLYKFVVFLSYSHIFSKLYISL